MGRRGDPSNSVFDVVFLPDMPVSSEAASRVSDGLPRLRLNRATALASSYHFTGVSLKPRRLLLCTRVHPPHSLTR